MDRRKFLILGGRLLLGGAIVLFLGRLLSHRRIRPFIDGNDRCDRKGLCRGCGEASRCSLPQALSFRSVFADPLSGGKR